MAGLKCLKTIQRIGRVRAIRKLITSIPHVPVVVAHLKRTQRPDVMCAMIAITSGKRMKFWTATFNQALLAR
jgi:hypothetical protein